MENLTNNESFIGLDLFKAVKKSSVPFIVDGVEIGLPFCLSDLVKVYGKKSIPDCLGIYHLFYNEQLVYVGMSKNIRGRLMCHLKDNDMPFNNVLWFCADQIDEGLTIQDILELEYKMIKKFKPVLNGLHANCR
jgi:hypothetical protein